MVDARDARTGRRLPEATVARLPRYLDALERAAAAPDAGGNVSSRTLAEAAGVNAAIVRKDLSYLGGFGTRGVGYDVDELVATLGETLGVVRERPVVIIGAGNLGRALAAYGGFGARGFRMAAMVDADPRMVGQTIAGLDVKPLDELGDVLADAEDPVVVLAIPAASAQEVVSSCVAAGVTAILSFAPASLEVPDGVTVRSVDLSTELQVLSFYDRLAGAGRKEGRTA